MVPVEISQFMMDNGTINYGSLMRYWRKHIMQWKSAQILTDIYNEVLQEDESLTVRSIQRIEQQNKVPMDQKRRWLLATILNIPPAYFGLTALAPYKLPAIGAHEVMALDETIDVAAYTNRLQHLWLYATSFEAKVVRTELTTKIQSLQERVIYGGSRQRRQMSTLLCLYLVLYGNILRDQGYSDAAILSLDKALKLAGEIDAYELGAKALYLKGYAHFDKWGVQPDRMIERTQLQYALHSFQAALKLAEESQKHDTFNGPLKSAIVAELGLVQAYNAQSAQEKQQALRTIDLAGTLIQRSDFQRDTQFLHVNDEWYHIDKAEAYVALQQGYTAVDELAHVDRSHPQTRRRYVYTDIVEADAYLTKKQVEIAVACAENALDLLEGMQSFIFVTRLTNIYSTLRNDKKYATSPDVARLGAKLLRIQHAYLFD